jgi:hypothetical protein
MHVAARLRPTLNRRVRLDSHYIPNGPVTSNSEAVTRLDSRRREPDRFWEMWPTRSMNSSVPVRVNDCWSIRNSRACEIKQMAMFVPD